MRSHGIVLSKEGRRLIDFGKRKKSDGTLRGDRIYPFVLLTAFLAGAFFGFFLARFSGSDAELSGLLSERLCYASQGNWDISFASILWDCLRWPLAVVISSFFTLGIVAIPALILVRGFLLSYAASCFAVSMQQAGVAAEVVIFFVPALLIIPVMFLLGCDGMRSTRLSAHGAASSSFKASACIETLLISIGILAVAVALQWAVVPAVLSSVCAQFF